MRDVTKTEEYFAGRIAFYKQECEEVGRQLESGSVLPESISGAYFDIKSYCFKILGCLYSSGKDMATVDHFFQIYLESYQDYHAARMKDDPCGRLQWVNLSRDAYQEYLNLLSWGVLLRKSRDTLEKIESLIDCRDSGAFCRRGAANHVVGNNRGKDHLLDLLLNTASILGPQSDSLVIGGIYKKLLQVCLASPEKRPALMVKYLDAWYMGNKSMSWHDTHLYDDRGYVGYWSFESALVVRLFDFDDSSFADHRYYPKDLARFQG